MLGGGAVTLLVAVIGFMFREKWKQMLQRSLTQDMEQIKHDFQQKLEAYKITLIAEAESAKAKAELRKSIALRYSEIEFERLVELEHIVAGLPPEVMAYAAIASEQKTNEQRQLVLDKVRELNIAIHRVGMFASFEDKQKFNRLSQGLIDVINMHVGALLPNMTNGTQAYNDLLLASAAVAIVVRERIKELG